MNFLELMSDRIDIIDESKNSLLAFTKETKKNYITSDFHRNISSDIDEFIFGNVNKMMVFAPPQHGKSELSTRRLPAMLLGLDPTIRIAVICYNSTIARGFNKNVQDIISDYNYRSLFPNTIINGSKHPKSIEKLKEKGRQLEKNSYMFETTEGGYLISTGVNGSLTSKSVDILIMDDLYKGKMDAYSPIFRQRVLDFYNSVAETRLHNKSKQLILYTRWHEEDLAGVLLEKESELWYVSKYEAIKETNENLKDEREIGEALWPDMHSKEKLLRVKKNDPQTFESLMQQNPRPLEGLLYENLKTYKNLPDKPMIIKSYTDTADEGKDYLSHVTYAKDGNYNYVLDIIYTQKKMELTEPIVASSMIRNGVQEAKIESNNGGKGFARNIERIVKEKKGRTKIKWFHQSLNKEARILTNASDVCRFIIFPEGWENKWPEAHKSMNRFLSDIKANEHDDLQDNLTGIIETELKKTKITSGIRI